MTPALPSAVWVLLGAPLAALGLGFFVLHRRRPSATHWPILISCALVTAAAWWLACRVYAGAAAIDQPVWRWVWAGNVAVDFGIRVDGMGAAVLAMVTLVGALIHAYSVGYMREDPGFSRFFLYFHLFLFSMIGLLLANNYLQLYLFWEGVGLASYLLIGFWYDRESARRAALKAFIVNRIGDASFLFAIFLMFRYAGTVRFVDLFASLDRIPPSVLPWIAALLFFGATAKSAQFPLYVWLPDAMEGPTPTSALMHAATMVTAGVFLMMRSWPILERTPDVLHAIAAVGAFTALGAAVLASIKKDLKRILAYSTVSHLGLMMMAIGAGDAYAAATHLVMHGFFKATLFLAAGNVLHALGRSSASVDEAGGLSKTLKLTTVSFALAAAALAGLPPFSGFFSKDLILEAARKSSPWLGACTGLIAVGSGFYIGRMFWLTFYGDRPEQHRQQHTPHPNPPPRGEGAHATAHGAEREHHFDPWLELPVFALAILSTVAGLLLAPTGVLRKLALAGPLWSGQPFPEPHFDWALAAIGFSAAVGGVAASWYFAIRRPSWDWEWRGRRPALEAWMDSDFGWQRAVLAGVVRPTQALSRFIGWTVDQRIWDRFVEATADSFLGLSEGLSGLSRGLLNEYIWWMATGAALILLGLAWVS